MYRKGFVFFFRWLLTALCLCSLPATAQHYSFSTLSQDADEEFPSRISCIMDDSHGYLWIGTRSGLGRHDGNHLKKYMLNEVDTLHLPGEEIYSIMEDADHDLWVMTNGGTARYDYLTDRFYPLTDGEGNIVHAHAGCSWKKGFLLDNGSRILYYDKTEKKLSPLCELPDFRWANKLCLIDEQTLLVQNRSNSVIRIALDKGEADITTFHTSFPSTDLLVDSLHQIWISTAGDGLHCFSPDGTPLHHYTTVNSGLNDNHQQSLTQCKGHLLIGTRNGGLNILKLATGNIWQMKHVPGDGQFTVPGNNINRLYTDRYDNVLMGIVDHGLVSLRAVFLRSYTSLYAGFGKGPLGNSITCFFPQGDYVWIGTADGGLNRMRPSDNTFVSYPSTKDMFIFSITDFAPGKLLISVVNQGMFVFDTATGQTTPFLLRNVRLNTYTFHYGNGVYLWRNTPESLLILGRHVHIYHQSTGTFSQATEEKEGMIGIGTLKMISTDKTVSYLCDRRHLYLLDHPTETLSILYEHPNEGEVINTATRTPDGIFWMGTNYGLLRYDAKSHELSRIPTKQFRDVMSVQADPLGRLWIGTYYALFSYNPSANRLIAYNHLDGVLSNEYVRGAYCFHDDCLYMGGIKGFVKISYPHAVPNTSTPVFSVSDCTLNGVNEGNPFLDTTRTVELPYKSNFTLRVSTKEKNLFRSRGYRFLIPAYSSEEIETERPEIQLHNLQPGTYQVQVSCTLSNGSWSPYQQIAEFTVLPPWYLSFWFIGSTSLLVLTLGGIGLWILLERKRHMMAHEIEQNRLRLNEEKVNFLVNVSHELRTPLTLIYSPLNRLLRQTSPDHQNYPLIQTARRQTLRMTHVINMVLDLEKMEHHSVQLQIAPHAFNRWVEEGIEDFVSEGKERGVKVVFEPDTRITPVEFDSRKCDIVLNNLIMNALKHSPENSTITIRTRMDEEKQQVQLSVSDEGTGLHPDEMKHLFTRFYQGTKENSGTGLGLAYSKVLLEQHNGCIGVYNNEKKGATFYFILPLQQTANGVFPHVTSPTPAAPLLPDETHLPAAPGIPDPLPDMSTKEAASDTRTVSNNTANSSYTLLVVDDQEDITRFLAESLKDSFRTILTAKDGVEALNILLSNRPDAVISDVMMPRMNGYELCQQIKKNLDISHIPVVLLTAKTDEQSVMMGYKTGADAYMPKPFDVEMVKQVVFNLLNTRLHIQEKYSAPGAVPPPKEATISYADEAFLTKLNQLVEQHIDNTDLDIALIESEMCMSRASLFNKMKVLTGMGCNEYITKMRMERATELVRDSSLSFTEISERVGYSTASYFSSAFKLYTGMTPTQYRKNQAGEKPSR